MTYQAASASATARPGSGAAPLNQQSDASEPVMEYEEVVTRAYSRQPQSACVHASSASCQCDRMTASETTVSSDAQHVSDDSTASARAAS